MIGDDDEYQPQDDEADSDIESPRDRERLFQSEVEEPDVQEWQKKQDEQARDNADELDWLKSQTDRQNQERDLRKKIDSRMNDFVGRFIEDNRREDQMRPPRPPARIETDFQIFPSTQFRKEEQPKQQAMLQNPSIACASGSVACDTVSASKSKCGFTNSNLPNRYFLHHEFAYQTECDQPGQITTNVTTANATGDVDSNCNTTTHDGTAQHTDAGGTVTLSFPLDGPQGSCGPISSVTVSGTTVTEVHGTLNACCAGGTWSSTRIFYYSIEDTTDQLKTDVIAALPAFDGAYYDTCGATYNLSSDETSFTLSRTKYIINFDQPLCAGAVVTWYETFTPTGGGSPMPTQKTYSSTGGGETMIGPYTIPDPTSNGTTVPGSVSVNCSGCPGGDSSGTTTFVEYDA